MAVVRAPRHPDLKAGQPVRFGAARIGERRPDPLLGRRHVMDASDIKTADKTGVYELADGGRVRIKEGEPLPLGAEFRYEGEDPAESPRQKERRLIAEAQAEREGGDGQRIAATRATENRARRGTAENREGGE